MKDFLKKFVAFMLGVVIATFLLSKQWLEVYADLHHEHYEWPSLSHFIRMPGMLPEARTGWINNVIVTAYDPYDYICVGPYAYMPGPRVTALDSSAEVPGIAADFKVFPPGTEITLPGIGTYKVDDTGAAMREDADRGVYHIDLRMPAQYQLFDNPSRAKAFAHVRAVAFGHRRMDIYVKIPDGR